MSSWTDLMRSWLKPAPRRQARAARPALGVALLEDRITPVLGAFDVPFAADYATAIGTTDTTGVVEYNSLTAGGRGTGALLDRGTDVVGSRHVLIAAHLDPHVGDTVSFFSRAADGTVKTIDVRVVDVWVHPLWNPANIAAGNDIAIATLASVAPDYATDYPIYTGSSEVGKPYTIAGYGLTGTGTSGQADFDLQRMTVTATGGQFRIYDPINNVQTAALNWNASASDIEAALNAIGVFSQVRQPTVGPYTNTFEILFLTGINDRRLQFVSDPTNPLANGGNPGSVAFMTLTNGGFDGEYQRLTVNATAGTFRLSLGGGSFTAALPYNATDAQIQAAIETLPGVTEATVRRITSGPAAGQFQVVFDEPTGGFPVLTIDTAALTGTASAYILQNDGRPVLRVGVNEYDAVVGTTLRSDFDNDGTDGFEGQGDSGGAGFIDTGGGQLAIASIVSNGGFVFGDPEFNTRVSTFASLIQAQTNAAGYTLTLDMQYQLSGNDGLADTIRVTQSGNFIQVYVRPGPGAAEQLYYQDLVTSIASIRLLGTSDDETFIVDAGVSKLVTIDGGGGSDTLVGPNAVTAYTVTGSNAGAGVTPTNTINFSNIPTVIGGAVADSFAFQAGGALSGNVDGGGGADALDFSATAGVSVQFAGAGAVDGLNGGASPVGGAFLNMNSVTGSALAATDVLTGFATTANWAHAGTGGVYTDLASGQAAAYANFETLTGGAGNDAFDLQSLGGPLTVNGGAGGDSLTARGTAGDDAVTAQFLSAVGDVTFVGLPQSLVTTGLEALNYDGLGGANAFTVEDRSGSVFGSAADPGGGIVYAPTGAASGVVRMGSVLQIGASSITAGLVVNGDPDGSGDTDTFTALGTSAAGRQSAYGEAVIGDGRDVITVTDTGVAVQSTTAGPLLPVGFGYTGGVPSFSTLYVATGNETGTQGDQVTVTPTARVKLIVDGMGPVARPGDRVTIASAGETTSTFVNDPSTGPPQVVVVQSADEAQVGLIGFESGAPPTPGTGLIAVATDAGPETVIQALDRLTGAVKFQVTPFPGFYGGASVATGDVTGDGVPDVVVGAGPGGGPRVAVFNGLDGSLVYDFFGYEDTFRGGVNVSAADMDGDGIADIVLGTGVGGGPRVRVLNGKDLSIIKDFFAYESTFRGGVNVASGDVTGDGTPDLVTSTGAGGGPRVVVLDGTTYRQVASFFVFDQSARNGFFVSVGDVDGDGRADIIAGNGAGGPAEVRVFSGRTRGLISDFVVSDPFDPSLTAATAPADAGVRVASADVNGDGIDDVITTKGPGAASTLRAYQLATVNPQTKALSPTLAEIRHQDVFDGGIMDGIFVGASN